MSAATPTGGELRAQRERLGLSVEEAANAVVVTRADITRIEDGLCGVAAYGRAYAAALDAEEARRVTAEPVPPEGVTVVTRVNPATGAELRARREALGWSFDDVTCRPEMYGDYDEHDIACMENCGAASLVVKWGTGAPAYAAALAAEEARRAAEPVPPAGVRVGGCASPTVIIGCGYVYGDGSIIINEKHPPLDALGHLVALARHRAAQHAAGDRQRKEKALEEARTAEGVAFRAHKAAEDAWNEARAALTAAREAADALAARKEAGL